MAKIVGRDEAAVKRVTCRGCASIIEYVQNEVKRGKWSDYSGDSGYYEYIECPECIKKVEI